MFDLKPCPYCGGDPLSKNNEDWDKTYDPDTFAVIDCSPSEASHFWVECEICQSGTRICGTEEEAVSAWNARTESADITALRDELAGARADIEAGRLIRLPEFPQNMNDILEPLKVQSALNSEVMKLNFRKEHKPKDVSILDYTIIATLQKVLTDAAALEGGLHA